MSRRTGVLVVGLCAGALSVPGYALAASPAQQCADAGGNYDKSGSTAKCVFPVGNSDNTKVVDQKGSFNSSHDEGYTNPGDNKPPGKQGGNEVGK